MVVETDASNVGTADILSQNGNEMVMCASRASLSQKNIALLKSNVLLWCFLAKSFATFSNLKSTPKRLRHFWNILVRTPVLPFGRFS